MTSTDTATEEAAKTPKLPRKLYEKELHRLQVQLVQMAEWVKREGARIVVVFEGRDRSGKGDEGHSSGREATRAGGKGSPRSNRRAKALLRGREGCGGADQSDRAGGWSFPPGRLRLAGGATRLTNESNSRLVGTPMVFPFGVRCLGRRSLTESV